LLCYACPALPGLFDGKIHFRLLLFFSQAFAGGFNGYIAAAQGLDQLGAAVFKDFAGLADGGFAEIIKE
jgi:hypothetical protein